ncbi:MAG: hypothetical protein NTZ87_03175 [Candidatus Nomurabacteria bacterium]|nr:hypothetical protein [Candidatus Nomurabacteria bacterium]
MNFDQPPVAIKQEKGLDMKKMGALVQLSGTIRLEDGGEILPGASEEDKKTFGSNNGFISFVTEGGVQYVTKYSSKKALDLEIAGYRRAGLGVPFSNGEKPSGSSQFIYNQWERMVHEKAD